MEPLENKEIRGLTGKTIATVFLGWSSLMITIILSIGSIKTEIRDNKKDADLDKKFTQYQIDGIRQTTELNSIQIKDLNNNRMKKLITIAAMLFVISNVSAQKYAFERDSIANLQDFRVKVKMASLKAANNILADIGQPTAVQNYAQIIITEPSGGQWLTSLSYGCITNPAVNQESSDSDIEFTVNSLFVKYAYAYYKIVIK